MIVFVIGIFAYPIATLFLYSAQNVAPSAFASSSFAGLDNYRYIFRDPLFLTAILNNLRLFLCVPVMVALSVILAAVLFERPRGWRDLPKLPVHPLRALDTGGRCGVRLHLRVSRCPQYRVPERRLRFPGAAIGWAAGPGRCRRSCSSSSGRSSASASCCAWPADERERGLLRIRAGSTGRDGGEFSGTSPFRSSRRPLPFMRSSSSSTCCPGFSLTST